MSDGGRCSDVEARCRAFASQPLSSLHLPLRAKLMSRSSTVGAPKKLALCRSAAWDQIGHLGSTRKHELGATSNLGASATCDI